MPRLQASLCHVSVLSCCRVASQNNAHMRHVIAHVGGIVQFASMLFEVASLGSTAAFSERPGAPDRADGCCWGLS